MFIAWSSKRFMICFLEIHKRNKTLMVSKCVSFVFECGAFIFQPILMIFFLDVPYKPFFIEHWIYFLCLLLFPWYKWTKIHLKFLKPFSHNKPNLARLVLSKLCPAETVSSKMAAVTKIDISFNSKNGFVLIWNRLKFKV